MTDRRAIPYTIIGGYLGAGKTTLLNDLLRHSQGLRLAILVNDFGDINIDASLIASHDGETLNLANGCICCSLADGFMQTLARLSHRGDEIDHVIVEASGVSDPVKIGQYGAILHYALDGVIVVADAEQLRTKAVDKYVGDTVVRQLQGADLLVLNKVDLVSPETLAEVRTWLDETAPGVGIVETSYGRVPFPILFGVHSPQSSTARAVEDAKPMQVDAEAQAAYHSHAYETWTFTRAESIAEQDLRAMFESLSGDVLRVKGFIHLADDPAHRYVLQLVGKRWTLSKDEPWGDSDPQTSLVFIGLAGCNTERKPIAYPR